MKLSFFTVQDHYPGRPRSIPELYRAVVGLAERADELGYDTFFSAEHHFHEYGVVPNPAVLLSAIAQRTTKLRLGSAIATLPFHNPVNVAEAYAMVDVLSGGRLVLGVGSGAGGAAPAARSKGRPKSARGPGSDAVALQTRLNVQRGNAEGIPGSG